MKTINEIKREIEQNKESIKASKLAIINEQNEYITKIMKTEIEVLEVKNIALNKELETNEEEENKTIIKTEGKTKIEVLKEVLKNKDFKKLIMEQVDRDLNDGVTDHNHLDIYELTEIKEVNFGLSSSKNWDSTTYINIELPQEYDYYSSIGELYHIINKYISIDLNNRIEKLESIEREEIKEIIIDYLKYDKNGLYTYVTKSGEYIDSSEYFKNGEKITKFKRLISTTSRFRDIITTSEYFFGMNNDDAILEIFKEIKAEEEYKKREEKQKEKRGINKYIELNFIDEVENIGIYHDKNGNSYNVIRLYNMYFSDYQAIESYNILDLSRSYNELTGEILRDLKRRIRVTKEEKKDFLTELEEFKNYILEEMKKDEEKRKKEEYNSIKINYKGQEFFYTRDEVNDFIKGNKNIITTLKMEITPVKNKILEVALGLKAAQYFKKVLKASDNREV